MTHLELTATVLLCLGTFFCLVGGIGIHRMPDFYTRTHAASITDTMGAGLVLIGLMFLCADEPWTVPVKLGMVLIFVLLTSPTSGHALVKAAAAEGIRWVTGPQAGDPAEEGETGDED